MPTPGTFYCVPKLHKLPKLIADATKPRTPLLDTLTTIYELAKSLNIRPPGRPIISGRGTLTEHLSGYVDSILNPLLHNIPSYTQDSTHFLRKINELKELKTDAMLVTLDVSSLYTNIPHNEGIVACRNFLTRHNTGHNIDNICTIINYILKHNYFTFNGKYYLQTKGTAMGTKMAPSYANIFMAT
ncbi:uncharacterized protein LOC117100033 [Anneissia japonica]|uniref:uncharacterized protein LOC117100033 n=1 Tax=Anneissia japonica TaxID=1529436 RepID=UPI001425A76F|nr:uncharacterized protein LOC117100033 [Anneissia japonica]